nr:hypothetical protein CFP56_34335 [Quercus suber]
MNTRTVICHITNYLNFFADRSLLVINIVHQACYSKTVNYYLLQIRMITFFESTTPRYPTLNFLNERL